MKQGEKEGTKEDLQLNAITARRNDDADAKCRVRSGASFLAAFLKLKNSGAITNYCK